MTAKQIYKNLYRFFNSIRLDTSEGVIYYKPYTLARSLTNKSGRMDVGIEKIFQELVVSALTASPLPPQILDSLIERFTADGFTKPRMALVRAYLIDNLRGTMSEEQAVQSIPPSINHDWDNVAYLLGRLLAVVDKLQRAAVNNNINSSLVDSYYSGLSTTPSLVLGEILNLVRVYITKVETEKKYLNWVVSEFRSIIGRFPLQDDTFSKEFSPMDQLRFSWGMFNEQNWLISEQQRRIAEAQDKNKTQPAA